MITPEERKTLLDQFQAIIQAPIEPKNLYLAAINNDYDNCMVVEWNHGFQSLQEKYPECNFYSTFLLWEGVEMFVANNEDKKIRIFRS